MMTTLTPPITDTMGNGQQVLYNDGKNGSGLRLTWDEDQNPPSRCLFSFCLFP